MRNRTLILIALAAAALCVLFLRDPGFGDDFTYWAFALDLHERGLNAWQQDSFHDLRWPVWLPIWIIQAFGGIGFSAYILPPLIYIGIGAAFAAAFARKMNTGSALAWTAGMAFALHPLLDSICYRPMPDLSEGVFGAAAIAAWWALMHAASRRAGWGWALVVGAFVFVAESNRLTGVFIAGVLAINTMLFFRKQFVWLIIAGAFATLFYVGECCFYKWLFDDWLHNLHANLGGKGRKGTDAVNLLAMPFRFLDSLWKGGPLAPLFCLLGLGGMVVAWRKHGTFGRVVVVWFWSLYLAYACAPQQLWPWRPLLRDADRFLAGLAVPGSVLAALGGAALVRWLFAKRPTFATAVLKRPALVGVVLVVGATALSRRAHYSVTALPELRRHVESVPAGTHILTHDNMRAYAILAAGGTAQQLVWHVHDEIIDSGPALEADAAKCAEVWYLHKLLWLNTRKDLEREKITEQPKMASYFALPSPDWRLSNLIVKGDSPDLVFLKRRAATDPATVVIEPTSPDFASILPAQPFEWAPKSQEKITVPPMAIPASLRGQLAFLEIQAESKEVEAFSLRIHFFAGTKLKGEYLLKPYLFPKMGRQFFALGFPEGADHYAFEVVPHKGKKSVRFSSYRIFVEPKSAP